MALNNRNSETIEYLVCKYNKTAILREFSANLDYKTNALIKLCEVHTIINSKVPAGLDLLRCALNTSKCC